MNCLFASVEVCREGPYRTGGHDIEPKRRLICGEQNLSLADFVLNSVRRKVGQSGFRQILEQGGVHQSFYATLKEDRTIFVDTLPYHNRTAWEFLSDSSQV